MPTAPVCVERMRSGSCAKHEASGIRLLAARALCTTSFSIDVTLDLATVFLVIFVWGHIDIVNGNAVCFIPRKLLTKLRCNMVC